MYKILRIIPLLLVIALSGCKEADLYKDLSAKQIYERGKTAALKKNYSQAIKDFDTLEARYPYGEWSEKGQLAIIHAYAEAGEGASALAAADRFIRMHPRHPNVDYAYYMRGVVNYDDNYSLVFRMMPLDRSLRESTYAQDGFDAFKTLLEKFPNSKYSPDARKRMIVLREQLADHELHIAQYYERQGADLAAANRAGYLINQYPQTKAVPEALMIMHRSYREMGMHKQAAETLAMLKENFPNYKK
ncbi:MAG TPA: outer membrane protein assembly factor BamD [Gammaproteobacteria bacterium]|nr:outer membrane protein assembly factor BamD [Gammaproteobacteria bacterium]